MKNVIVVALIVCSVNHVDAQIRRTVAGTDSTGYSQPVMDTAHKMRRREMLNELNLTKEQRASIREIQREQKAKKEMISANDSLTDDQKKIELRKLKKETEKSIESTLTDEQLQKLKELKKEMHNVKKDDDESMMQDDPGYTSGASTTK